MLKLMCDPQGHKYSVSADHTGIWIGQAHGGYDAIIKLSHIRVIGDVIVFDNGLLVMDGRKISHLRYGNRTFGDCGDCNKLSHKDRP